MGAQYYDAKWVKKAITRLVLVETLGGIAPPIKQFLHARVRQGSGGHQHGPDGVRGAASASASSFVVHHTQQISMAAVAKSQSSARDGRAIYHAEGASQRSVCVLGGGSFGRAI